MNSSLPMAALGEIAELNPPLPASLSDSEEVSFMPMSAVDAESVSAFNRETRRYSEVSKGYTPFVDGDVLVAKITPCFENGKIAQAQLTRRYGFGSTEFHVVRPRPGRSDARYLVHYLRQDGVRRQGESRMTGSAGQRRVPEHFLAELSVPLPTLPEQRRIAKILDEADAMRAKRRAALAQLNTLTNSIFLDMFGDPRNNEKNWVKAQIGSVVSDMRGGAALEPDDFVEEGFPILHKGAIKPNGKISIDPKKKTFAPREYAQANQRSQVNREFVAVTLRDLVPSGPSIGLSADLRDGPFDEYLLAQGAYGFRLDPAKVNPEYFVQLSNMPNFRHVLRQNAVGSTQIHIRTPIYLRISIPLPPVQVQCDFALRIKPIERIKLFQLMALGKIDELFVSLLQRAFRGEL